MKPDGSMRVCPTFYPEMKEKDMSLMELKTKLSKLNKKKHWYACHIRYRDGAYRMLITHGHHEAAYTPGWQMNVHEEWEDEQRDVLYRMDRNGVIIPCAWKYYDIEKKNVTKKPRKVTLDDWL